MHKPTSYSDRIFIAEDGAISRLLTANWYKKYSPDNIKDFSIDIYVENEFREAGCQNVYYSMYGYVVAFPGEVYCNNSWSYHYSNTIAEEEGFGECKLMPNLGDSYPPTPEEIELICNKYPEFRYTLEKYKCKTKKVLMQTLMLWNEHPQCERILACGYTKVAHNKMFYKLSKPKAMEVCRFMQKHKYLDLPLNVILSALKTNKSDQYLNYIANTDTSERKTITFADFNYLMLLEENNLEYKKDIFCDYIRMLKMTEHDITQEYWRHPKDLVQKHDKLVAELEEIRRRRQMQLKRERAKALKEISNRFKQYDLDIDGYRIFVTTDFSIWEKHAKALHQCICAGSYYDYVASGQEILVFICKGKKHIATAEVYEDKTLGQFYADERDRENCRPTPEVIAAFDKWLKQVPKSKFKRQKPKTRKVA